MRRHLISRPGKQILSLLCARMGPLEPLSGENDQDPDRLAATSFRAGITFATRDAARQASPSFSSPKRDMQHTTKSPPIGIHIHIRNALISA